MDAELGEDEAEDAGEGGEAGESFDSETEGSCPSAADGRW